MEKYIKNYLLEMHKHVEADAFLTLQLDQCRDLTETMKTRQDLGTAFESRLDDTFFWLVNKYVYKHLVIKNHL